MASAPPPAPIPPRGSRFIPFARLLPPVTQLHFRRNAALFLGHPLEDIDGFVEFSWYRRRSERNPIHRAMATLVTVGGDRDVEYWSHCIEQDCFGSVAEAEDALRQIIEEFADDEPAWLSVVLLRTLAAVLRHRYGDAATFGVFWANVNDRGAAVASMVPVLREARPASRADTPLDAAVNAEVTSYRCSVLALDEPV